MSTSFIDFNKKGIWLHDSFVETLLRYFLLILEREKAKPEWLVDLYQHYFNITKGHFPGWINLRLDEVIIDEDRKAIFISMLEKTVELLNSRQGYISVEELNNFITNPKEQGVYNTDVNTEALIEGLISIKQILLGNLGYRPEDPDSKRKL